MENVTAINRYSFIARLGGGTPLGVGLRRQSSQPVLTPNGRVIKDEVSLSREARSFLSSGNVPETASIPSSTAAGKTVLTAEGLAQRPDTTNLAGLDFSGGNLAGRDLHSAMLRDTNLSNASLQGADLRWADFNGANVTNAAFAGADLRGANLSNAIGLRAEQLDRAKFDLSTLLPAGLSRSPAPVAPQPIAGPDYSDSYLHSEDYGSEDLQRANFGSSDLTKADFGRADLRGANFDYATLTDADFTAADLSGADLSKALDLTADQLAYAVYDGTTKLPDHLSYLNVQGIFNPDGRGYRN